MTPVLDKPSTRATERHAPQAPERVSRSAVGASATVGLRRRLAVLRATRYAIAADPEALVSACRLPWRTRDAETLQAEVLPLCDAMRGLERWAASVLRGRRVGARRRPAWLWGVSSVVRREPVGTVLIVAPANYPLLLPGVQLVQAYAAGNRVAVKPAPGCRAVMDALVAILRASGMDTHAVEVLDADPAEATRRIEAGAIDKVFLTGSDRTGRAVMRLLADCGVPSVMELSGCDAMAVLEDAELDRVVKALRFGLRFNASQTCIAPRRVLVHAARYDALCARADEIVRGLPEGSIPEAAFDKARAAVDEAVAAGASVAAGALDTGLVLRDVTPDMAVAREDLFAPVTSLMRCRDAAAMRDAYAHCDYRLGASVFGHRDADAFADELDAGHVVVNDLIAPTADPRLPFPARGRSGFGVTRGPEGLLEMTQPKVTCRRRGGLLAHLDEPTEVDDDLAHALLRAGHARGLASRLAAFATLARLGKTRSVSPHGDDRS